MSYEVRAMSFGEILDTGLRLLRDRFATLTGIKAASAVPLALIAAMRADGAARFGGARAAIAFLVIPITSAVATRIASGTFLGGAEGVGDGVRAALPMAVPLVGTMLLSYLVVLSPISVTVLFALRTHSLLAAVLALLAVGPTVYAWVGLLLVEQVIVLERRYWLAALRRSWTLVRGNRARVVGAMAVAWLLGLSGALLAHLVPDSVPVVGSVIGGLAGAIGAAYAVAVAALLYFDIRCRNEAFDLHHLADLVAAQAAPL